MTGGSGWNWAALLPGSVRRRLEGRENLQRIIGNTGWLVADKIVRMGIGLFVNVWVARYLGPEVPAEDLVWQDPIPAVNHPLVDAQDVRRVDHQAQAAQSHRGSPCSKTR